MSTDASASSTSILVVNDQIHDRQYLSALFRHQGYAVLEADDAWSALALIEREKPALVISAARVPPVGGFEFVRRVRATAGAATTPIVFYTRAGYEREARAVAELCGVQDILAGSSEPDLIVDRVHALILRARQGHAAADPPTPLQVAPSRSSLQLIDMVEEFAAIERQLTAVAALCQRLARELDPGSLLQVLVEGLLELTGAECAMGGLFTETGQDGGGRVTAGVAGPAATAITQARLTDAFRASMLRRHAIRWEVDRQALAVFEEPLVGVPLRSCLAVPLLTPSTVHGWVVVANPRRGPAFTEHDEAAATTLGGQAGIAYANAALIEELQRRSAQLQTSAVHTTFALEAAHTGVWTWDVPSDRWHGSESLQSVLELPTPHTIQSLDMLLACVARDDRARVEQAFRQSAADLSGLNVEFTTLRPDASVRVVQAHGRVSMDAAGRAARMHGVLTDVTDRRILEAQLRQAQRIETVGLLAGGIAHDFNNMLTAILGYARLAEDQVAQRASPLAEVQQIAKAAERASLLTRQLLAFSRQHMLEPMRLDVNAVVEELSVMLGRLIGDHIQVVLTLDKTLPHLLADRSQIEQVVMNLAVNARDAMPNGGRVEIATSLVTLTAEDQFRGTAVVPGRYVVLSISDTGSGIPDDVMGRIFDPFFTTKERGRGTGLGLATVYGILRQTGGYVDVVSEPGRGSTFLAYFPALLDELPVAAVLPPPTRARGGSERILVVEDEPEVRRLVRTVLERAGYRVADAANAREAERILASSAGGFELLITDIVMPGGTGAELFQRLVQVRPTMKAVFMSGYADDQLVAETVAQPGTVFLQKPFTIEALVRRVREALDR